MKIMGGYSILNRLLDSKINKYTCFLSTRVSIFELFPTVLIRNYTTYFQFFVR